MLTSQYITKYTMLLILSFLLYPTLTSGFLNIPENIDFTSNFYNLSNTNCTHPFKTVVSKNMCYDTNLLNGYPKCCNELLSATSFYPNTSFNTCIPFYLSGTNLRTVSYDCSLTKMDGLTRTEIFAYVGIVCIILLGFLSLMCLCCCMYKCCKRNSYSNL